VGETGERALLSSTVPLDPGVDPSAIAFGSRRAGDRWFCWERPDDRFALAGVGTTLELVSRGPNRFADLARDAARALHGHEAAAPDDLPAGAGPVWTAGFAFDPDGGSEPRWSSLPPALAVLPELTLFRNGDGAYLTATAAVGPGTDLDRAIEGLRGRLGSFQAAALTPRDPQPSGTTITGRHPPDHYEGIVSSAIDRIASGAIEKVVLSREVTVEAPSAQDPQGLFGALRDLFGSCFCFCFGTPEAAFVGASPELLIRRSGAVAATVALAGTTARSADPAVDDHLGEAMLRSPKVRNEHQIVVRRIQRALRPHAVWAHAEDEPSVIKIANLQHLATPIRAQLAESRSVLELAGLLHPTPAVGGEPREDALDLIAELEGMDRGWYAGPIGWMDAADDGEFCVGLRSALLRDRAAHLYAGNGIVADSDPADELAETELKFAALLPLLTG
jgi:salicylate biosynthesis isochorismate synthase/menaquinone-specific isochorismate synthase